VKKRCLWMFVHCEKRKREMMRLLKTCRSFLVLFAVISIAAIPTGAALAAQVVVPGAQGYGFNVIPPPAGGNNPGDIVGCGPTSGVMILKTYTNQGATGLIGDALTDAWDMHYNYMNTDSGGFGKPSDFQFGVEDFALDRGYIIDAVVHVEPTSFDPTHWTAYTEGPDLAKDATFWDTSSWDIVDNQFLAFLKAEIDADRPVGLTVDSDKDGKTDHWMVGVGYDLEANQWAGFNTFDSSLHWYDVQSAFIAGNTMGIGFVRTFDYLGPVDDGGDDNPSVPEPGTFLLLGAGLFVLAGVRRRVVR
jgi:hypothetical protein